MLVVNTHYLISWFCFTGLGYVKNRVEEEVQSQTAANVNNPVENNPPEIQLPSNQACHQNAFFTDSLYKSLTKNASVCGYAD